MDFKELYNRLWSDYAAQNPSAGRIHKLFTENGEVAENDHIAFRTFDDERVGIHVLAKPFISVGYEAKGEYFFKEKKLHAIHFENSNQENAPKVFISELKLEECSQYIKDKVKYLINNLKDNELQFDDLIFKGNLWGKPSFEVYDKLRAESEYAAWLYVYGFRTNHFTVSINSLKKFNTIEKVNDFLKQNGFVLNASGGEIKGTPEMLLQQSSTMADIIDVEFTEGNFQIPACYYEFAMRYPDKDGNLYSGFHEKSADKIFESTNFYKKME
jgi:hypothetical protein